METMLNDVSLLITKQSKCQSYPDYDELYLTAQEYLLLCTFNQLKKINISVSRTVS